MGNTDTVGAFLQMLTAGSVRGQVLALGRNPEDARYRFGGWLGLVRSCMMDAHVKHEELVRISRKEGRGLEGTYESQKLV